MLPQDNTRILLLINRIIKQLDLNLNGLTILTEVGSNYFLYTPIIAALAGAKTVYAWTRDSAFGLGIENVGSCKKLMQILNIDNIEFASNERPQNHIELADIITNLNFVRPLNADFLVNIKGTAAVPIMCELWETRPSDIDLDFCKKNKIKTAGTWENHPDLKIFSGCGPLAIKMAFEAGFEIYQNSIFVWSDDHFGEVISDAFTKFGAKKVIHSSNIHELNEAAEHLDFIFFCDYDESREIIGKNGFINLQRLIEMNPSIGILHLYGQIDFSFVSEQSTNIWPKKNGRTSIMTNTLAHLGPMPIINLHAAGLKVGESLFKNIENDLVQKISYE